jgi:hypothetical protein
MARAFYVTKVEAVSAEAECVCVLAECDDGPLTVRCSLNTLLAGMEQARRAVEKRQSAKVVPLPDHR